MDTMVSERELDAEILLKKISEMCDHGLSTWGQVNLIQSTEVTDFLLDIKQVTTRLERHEN